MKSTRKVALLIAASVFPLFADLAMLMGSGNINENATKAELTETMGILKTTGVTMLRLANSGYYDQYGNGGPSEKRLDSLVLWSHAASIPSVSSLNIIRTFPIRSTPRRSGKRSEQRLPNVFHPTAHG